jgi:hypothetical protein
MNLNDLVLDATTSDLLKQAGKQDRENGVNRDTGWETLRKELGLSSGRTPAREAYEDGFYS